MNMTRRRHSSVLSKGSCKVFEQIRNAGTSKSTPASSIALASCVCVMSKRNWSNGNARDWPIVLNQIETNSFSEKNSRQLLEKTTARGCPTFYQIQMFLSIWFWNALYLTLKWWRICFVFALGLYGRADFQDINIDGWSRASDARPLGITSGKESRRSAKRRWFGQSASKQRHFAAERC